MLLISSVAIVASLDLRPPPSSSPTREPVQHLVEDLLAGLKDLPTGDRYRSSMERAIAHAVLGNTTHLERLIDRTLPPGCECRLWLDNGHVATRMTGTPERLARESVSASVLWRPTWAYSLVMPSLDVITSLQPLDLQGYAVSQGSLVKEHGVPVAVELTTSTGSYTKSAQTAIRPAPAASLYLLNETGQANYVHSTRKNVYQDFGPGLLTTGSFVVPSTSKGINLTASFSGTTVSYTLLLTAPDLSLYTYTGSCTTACNLSAAPPLIVGTWNFAFTQLTATSGVLNVASSLDDVSDWTFVLRAEGTTALPKGTNLTLRLPFVFTEAELTDKNQNGWRNVNHTLTVQDGNRVSAELNQTLAGGSTMDFVVHAKRPTLDADPLYLVHAELGNGTSGKATFVLAKAGGTQKTYNPAGRTLYLSVPKPMAPGASSHWGAVFPYASPTGLGLGEELTQLDIRSADGRELFSSVTPVWPADGWTKLSGSHLRWSGSRTLGPNDAAAFVVKVTAASNATADEPSQALPIEFPSARGFHLQEQARPYVFQSAIPPADWNSGWGYQTPTLAGTIPMGNGTVGSDWTMRGMPVRGNATYTVSSFPPVGTAGEALRAGLARSHLNFSRNSAKVGEDVTVTVDFQGLLSKVDELGSTATAWSVDLILLDPSQPLASSPAQWRPLFKGSFGNSVDTNLSVQWFQDGEYRWDPVKVNGESVVTWYKNDVDAPPRWGNTLGWGASEWTWDMGAWALGSPWVNFNSVETFKPQASTGNITLASRAYANITFQPPRSGFYGPHAVIAEARLLLNDADGKKVAQTARLIGVLDVLPDSGQSETALYWVTLECWLPDW